MGKQSSACILLVLLGLAGAPGGCHLIFPFDLQEASTEAGPVDLGDREARAEAGPADLAGQEPAPSCQGNVAPNSCVPNLPRWCDPSTNQLVVSCKDCPCAAGTCQSDGRCKISLLASADSYTHYYQPATLFHGGDSPLMIGRWGTDDVWLTYLNFQVPAVLQQAEVEQAVLSVFVDAWSAWTGAKQLPTEVRTVTSSWKEGTITFKDSPTVSTAAVKQQLTFVLKTLATLEVTGAVQISKAGGAWYGLRLGCDGCSDKTLHLASRETSNAPRLEITYR